MMGYKKSDERLVKPYVNSFFKENEKRLTRKITNLLLFQCETWVTSIDFFNKRIKKCQEYFGIAAQYSITNLNERRIFNINLFNENFCDKIEQWKKGLANSHF